MAVQFLIERIDADGTEIKGITRSAIDPQITRDLRAGCSELDPSLVNVTRCTPQFTFATLDMSILTTMFLNTIPHIAIATKCDLWLQAAAAGGTRGGVGTNTKCGAVKGIIIPTRLANVGGLAELSCAFYADYNGAVAPVVYTADQNLPAGAAGATSRWVARALKNNTTVLSKLGNLSLDFGITVRRQIPANSIYSYDTVIERHAPTMDWDTEDLATALTASGLSGAVAGAAGMILYIGQYDQATTPFVLAASARTITFRTGSVWFPTTLRRGGEGEMTVGYRCIGLGSAAAPPLAHATGATLPAETTDAAAYRIGPAKDNTTEVALSDWSLDFGQDWRVSQENTLQWPSYCTLVARQPSFQITAPDVDYLAAVAVGGKMVATAFAAYARKMTANSQQQADASAVHIKISCASGLIETMNLGGESEALINGGLRVTPTAGLTLATASAIT